MRRHAPDIGVAEEQPNLLESLVLSFGEQEVTDNTVADVGAHVHEEVFVAEMLETIRGDLGNDDVVSLIELSDPALAQELTV